MIATKKIVMSLMVSFFIHGCSTNDNQTTTKETNTTNNNSTTVSAEPYYKYLWHIDSSNSHKEKIAQELSNALNNQYKIASINESADINILQAWEITKGKDTIVAVIDDGVDIKHKDLKANIYKTFNADDSSSNVSNTSNDITTASHGNTCAGFIVTPINGTGIIGTAPEAKLIAIKLDGSGDIETIRAFEYAKNNGAKVISCSWGTENVSDAIVAELKSLYDANITVLFASGNDGKSLDTSGIVDESEVEWVIGIGASNELNDVTSYSNYGKNIEILSPGGDADISIGLLGLDDSGTQGSTTNYGLVSNDYAFGVGTSYATPIAAGAVALMYSANPNLTAQEVKEILTSTADKIGDSNATYINGFDEKRAYGKINAYKAVNKAIALK